MITVSSFYRDDITTIYDNNNDNYIDTIYGDGTVMIMIMIVTKFNCTFHETTLGYEKLKACFVAFNLNILFS